MGGQDQVWEVVGGEGKGGILVRQGKETASPKEEERLATGARVREVTLADGRLQYQLITGGGPQSGWVSVKLGDKDLLVKLPPPGGSEDTPVAEASIEPSDPAAPRHLRPHREVAPKFAPCGHLEAFKPNNNAKKFKESCAQRLPGNLYGLPLPRTPEEMGSEEFFGAKWLTEAFHKAGTLPKSNAIKRVVDGRRFVGGGSGPKVLFHVEYERPDENLDTALFGKFPWTLEENPQQKVIEQGQGKFGDNWGGEINFYRFVSSHVSFPVPKLYFGDLNRETSEAIIINAAVPWPEEGKQEFEPFEVMPPCGKCEDYLLKDPHEYYFAMIKRQGTLAGLGKTKKLGPDEGKVKWYDYNPKTDVFCSFAMPGHEKALRKLVEETAPQIFPEEVRNPAFLDCFEAQMAEICKAQESIAQYIYADVLYTGFQHQNGNTDNAYFYRRSDCELDCGLLDWGSFAHLAFASAFQGSFVSCLGNMLAEYDDRLICAWASYEEWVKRGKVGPAKAAENAAAAEEHARLLKLSVRELKEQIAEVGLSAAGATEKEDLVRLLEKGRAQKSVSKGSFVPSDTWQAVPKGVAIPAGLEVKFDLDKGCNYARTTPGKKK